MTSFDRTANSNSRSAELSEQQLDLVTGGGIGSQSSGAGAGKVTFNPFSITRKVDKASPIFF
jgi:type VI protein secretion system component Hcp